jgi:hypothetical protein
MGQMADYALKEVGIVVYRPNGEEAIIGVHGITLPSEWLENWRDFIPRGNPDNPEGIGAWIAREMLTDRYQVDKQLGGDLLKWAATCAFINEKSGEALRKMRPDAVTLVIRDITLHHTWVHYQCQITTMTLEEYLKSQGGELGAVVCKRRSENPSLKRPVSPVAPE